MTTTQHVLFGVTGQSLIFDCPDGQPSACTVTVYEDVDSYDDTAETATTGAVTIDTVSTTTDAAAGRDETDPTLVPLTATTGIVVGRRYLLTDTTGLKEWVEPIAISSGVSVTARHPLANNYSTGATFVGVRCSISVLDSWAADENNRSHPLCPRPRYRVRWQPTVAGVVYRYVTPLDLVEDPFQTQVTALDVDRLSRGWLARLASEDFETQGRALIDEAVQQVKLDLWERGVADYALRSPTLDELIRRKAVELVHEQAFHHGSVGQAQLQDSRDQYWKRVDNLVAKSAQVVTDDGAGGERPAAPIWRR